MAEERRLAAVWAADVVGYSALMERDEAKTLARLFALRAQVIEPLIAEHDGRIFKTTGDGVLAEFASVVKAVRAGVAVQSMLATRPDRGEFALQLRIGIHAGEVVVVADDLFGDGVNLAARLEGAAESGGVTISEPVYSQLRGELAEAFSDVGELMLKNISRPVRGYRWTQAANQAQPRLAHGTPALMAVLPFQSLSTDSADEFFAEGMVEDLITLLSRSSWFDVISRSSSELAARDSGDAVEAGRRLGARFVVEGSVRFAGERVRVTARLVDTETGLPRWSDRFDRVVEDLFDLQDELVKALVGAIEPEYVAAWRDISPARSSLTSWELAMRAWSTIYRGAQAPAVMDEARGLFERAIEEDTSSTLALGGLAFTLVNPWYHVGAVRDLERAAAIAERATVIDEREAFPWAVLGYVHLIRGELDVAERDLHRALALNPSLTVAATWLAIVYAFRGDRASTAEAADRAFELGPLDPMTHSADVARALTCFTDADYESAITWAKKALGASPQNPPAYRILAASLQLSGDHTAATDAVHELRALGPVTVSWLRDNLYPFGGPETQGRYLAALAAAGIPD